MTEGSIFGKNFGVWFLDMFGTAMEKACVFVFEIIKGILPELLLLAVIMFIFAFGEYFFTGRWKSLGSVTYNILKYSILLVIAFMFGAGVFAKDWFEIITAVIELICYITIGRIFRK
jgi:hypothetical protein